MFRRRYNNVLTIILIVAIIIILGILTFLGVKLYKKYKVDAEASNAIIEFEQNTSITNNTTTKSDDNGILDWEEDMTTSDKNDNAKRKVTYYKNFIMLGYIEIPSVSIKYPILETETTASLEVAVAVRYPTNAQLNEKGNVVIAGHNYRNGLFFSNLKNVSIGDKVSIKDLDGKSLVYKIYKKYETTPEDTSFITRNTEDNTEITLVTCTDDSQNRIIVYAKAEK